MLETILNSMLTRFKVFMHAISCVMFLVRTCISRKQQINFGQTEFLHGYQNFNTTNLAIHVCAYQQFLIKRFFAAKIITRCDQVIQSTWLRQLKQKHADGSSNSANIRKQCGQQLETAAIQEVDSLNRNLIMSVTKLLQ